ncbi:MAG TPA: endonuclease/exonuclease/phosphatase family protein [Nannocystaceae bacterium]|nr:endonuclease/exonuclease/phosphatase family protein [Nannocystaceae bacterium]
MPSTRPLFSCALTLCSLVVAACGPKSVPQPPQVAEAPAPVVAPEPAPPPPPPPKVASDAFAIGTFNLDWAIDAADVPRTTLGKENRAKTEDDWAWKRDGIAELLAKERLDVVGLQELGGERELADIAWAIEQEGGPKYDWVFVPSDDQATGLHVGLLSRFPIANERRLDANMRKQMAADVELPSGDTITVVVVHARSGHYPAYLAERRKQARSVKRALVQIAKTRPVVVLGTFHDLYTPSFPEYAAASVGIFAGTATKPATDDCQDSAAHVGETTVTDTPAHRVFSCGLWMRAATASGRALVVRGPVDPPDARWTDVPIATDPQRDLGENLVVWAELELPKTPAAEGATAAE